jgi:cytochrome c5
MLARTLAARVRDGLRLAPSLACLLRRGYASRAAVSSAAAADDIAIDEDQPRAATASSSAAALAATVPTVLQPRVLIYDGVCHLCHRGETLRPSSGAFF